MTITADSPVEPLFTPSFFDLDLLVADAGDRSLADLPQAASSTVGPEIDYVFAPVAGPSFLSQSPLPPHFTVDGIAVHWPTTLYMPSADTVGPTQQKAATPGWPWAGAPQSMTGPLAGRSDASSRGDQSLHDWLRTQASTRAAYPMSAYASPTASFSGLPTPPDQRRSSLPFEPNLPPDILPAVAARAAAKWRDFTRQRAGPSLAGLSSALPSSPSHAICLGDVSTGGFGSPAHSPTASSSARSYGSTSSNDEWLFRPHFTTFPIPQASDRRLSTASTASSAPLPAGPAVHHLQRAAGRYEPYATAAASTSTTRCGTNASIATTSTTVAGVNGDASGSTEGKTKEELRRERKRVTNRNSARNQREKKRLEIEGLQARIVQSDARLAQLQALEQVLRAEHDRLSA